MSTRRDFLLQAAAAGAVATTAADSVGSDSYAIPHTDLTVSRLAYGCGSLAQWNRDPLSSEAVGNAVRAIDTAYQNGISLFDLADMYAYGKAELAFGKALQQLPGMRNHIVIQSKCGIEFAHSESGAHELNCSREYIVAAAEASLQRLGTDHLDILMLHWPDALFVPEEVSEAFDHLKRSGKVRYFGVSNHTGTQIDLLRRAMRQPLVANQIHLSLADSYLIAGGIATLWSPGKTPYDYTVCASTLDYCRSHDIQIQAYSPLRGDLLRPNQDAPPEVKKASQVLVDLARQKNTTPSAICLAWLLHHPAKIVPVFSATSLEHVVENCAANRISLNRSEWYSLLMATVNLPRA